MNDFEDEGETGAEREAYAIFSSVLDYKVKKDTVCGFIFDTTALNSGLFNGVVVRLQALMGCSMMQLACRHHILELVCGASCSLVYHDKSKNGKKGGKKEKGTESPEEPLFKAFAANWKKVDQSNYCTYTPKTREQSIAAQNLVVFLIEWLLNGNLRHDYKEVIELSIMYLGGVFPSNYKFTFKAPSAFTHARWMSKLLYTLKYALFGHQTVLDIDSALLENN